MEIYKKIEGKQNYSVSNIGNVRNDKTGRILKLNKKSNGYLQVMLGRKTTPLYVHRLVATAFVGNPLKKPQVNHINGDKGDNRAENLEWVTVSENALAYGYDERIEHRKKKIIATNIDGRRIEFNSRNDAAKFFKCNKSLIEYGRVYKRGNKKGWMLELKI